MSLPPVEIPLGAMRFNSDSQKLEYFNGEIWMQINTLNPDLNGGVRGISAGGVGGDSTWNTINYITMSTSGNGVDFGDLSYRQYLTSGTASRTRGIFMGGYTNSPSSTYINSISTLEIDSGGGGSDFGDLSQTAGYTGSCGNQTRGIRLGGTAPANPGTNTMDYVTIAVKANAIDYGDLGHGTSHGGGINSPIRGVCAVNSDSYKQMEYITIPTKGNSTDFGTLSYGRADGGGMSNSVRGIFAGGYMSPGLCPHMDYITISTTGNSTDFGDMNTIVFREGNASSPTRGFILGGMTTSPWPGRNEIQSMSFATAGKSVDFGDLPYGNQQCTGCSNGHGGLG